MLQSVGGKGNTRVAACKLVVQALVGEWAAICKNLQNFAFVKQMMR